MKITAHIIIPIFSATADWLLYCSVLPGAHLMLDADCIYIQEVIYSPPSFPFHVTTTFWNRRTKSLLVQYICSSFSQPTRNNVLKYQSCPRTKQAHSPCALFSWGVFRFLCWDYYLQGNRPTHLFRLPLEHKGVVRTLKFSRQALTLCLHLWFVSPFDSGTFYLIQLQALTRYYSFVYFFIFQKPLFSLITVQIKNIPEKTNYFALSSLKKVIGERRMSDFFYDYHYYYYLNFLRW